MEKRFVSNRYLDLTSTAMSEVDVLARRYPDLINFSLGDPDLITEDVIIDGAMKDAKAGHTHYCDFQGEPELITEIINFYKEEYDIELPRDEVFVTAGGCVAMYLSLEAVLNDGDEVIIQAPYFTPYPDQVKLTRGVPVELDTYEEEKYQLNPDRLRSLITDKTRVLIINYPSNPAGACYTRETLEEIARIAEEYDLLVISDEIYTAFSYQIPFIPFRSIGNMAERTITINSFSKNFNMTGWRVGNIVAPAHLIKVIQEIDGNVTFTASSVSQRAAIHALRHRKEIQPSIIDEYRSRVMYVHERVNRIPNMSVMLPQGTFYMFINIKETGLTSKEVSQILLEEAHVLTIPGNGFGRCGEGYLRLACTMKKDNLEEANDRIEKVSIFRQKG